MLGVDAGNSKTVALVAIPDGRVVGAGRSGCGDISNRAVGAAAALANVAAAVDDALREAGVAAPELAAAAFSMAGADWPEDFAFLRAELRARWGGAPLVVNDAVGALRGGSPQGTGVAVVCGTYAVSAARAPDGRVWHASFWQETGGGVKLGEEALRVACRAQLGIDPATTLQRAVPAALGHDSVEGALHALTARDAGDRTARVARLARVVLDEAAAGDPAAAAIVAAEGRTLADYALAAARRVGIERTPFRLLLTGGVFRHPSDALERALGERLRALNPGVAPFRGHGEPILGALLLAAEGAGVAVDDAVYARLRGALPALAWFATG